MLLKQLFSKINCLYISPLVLAGLNSAAGLQGKVPVLHRPESDLKSNLLIFLMYGKYFSRFFLPDVPPLGVWLVLQLEGLVVRNLVLVRGHINS